jgi:hypothetical protein
LISPLTLRPTESSGDQIDVRYLNTIFELYSRGETTANTYLLP